MFKEFQVALPHFENKIYDIRNFGAVGDGKTSNTTAFKKAIEEAHKTGGQVLVPNGFWLTGPIKLLSNVELHLEDNALILFDKNPEEYPLVITDYEGIERIRATALLSADHAENIAITGKGTIDGNGHLWRPVKDWKLTKRQWDELLETSQYLIHTSESTIWVPSETILKGNELGEVDPREENALEKAAPYYDLYRPVMVELKYCNKVLIDGVTLQNSPAWNVHPLFCTDLTVRNAFINNPYSAQNGDGIDIESCKNVEVHNSKFQVGDDGICIKSGKGSKARETYGPSENIYIHDCYVGDSHGGFVIGSEMSRGVKNILVENCTFINADVGIRFKSAMGRGGVVEDIYIQNINMLNIKGEAMIFTMNYVLNSMGEDEIKKLCTKVEDIPEFKNIYIKECNCFGAKDGIVVQGLDIEKPTIHDIYIEDCYVESKREHVFKHCENIVVNGETKM